MASWSTTRWALLWVSVFGLIWAHAIGLTQFADPTAIDWMIEGDWLGHLFGWLFVRNGPWQLPLAQAPDLVFPAGSSAALTDAIPLLSVIGKIISPLFGDRFQLFGLWMVLGVIGTGVVGVMLCRAWFDDVASLTLSGLLFVMNPIVTTRYGHPPFFAFWMLSALVGLAVWPIGSAITARRVAMVSVVLGFFICSTTAYLAVMGAVVSGISVFRLAFFERRYGWGEAIGWLFASPVACVSALWLFGFVAGAQSSPSGTLGAEGFGQFSADLLTFFNAATWSRLIPAIGMGPRQYEGYAYLGLGVILLLVLRIGLLARERPRARTVLPLVVVCVGMALYALSDHVTIAGKQIADFTAFYARLAPIPSTFRSSGRFVWPLFCLLTLSATIGPRLIATRWIRHFVLGGAVLVQFVDFGVTRAPLHKNVPTFKPLSDPAWSLMKDGYRHVVIHPIQIQWTCPFNHELVSRLSWEAYRQHLSINSGHVGRAPPGTDCQAHLAPGALSDDTVYLPYFQQYLADFTNAGFVCGQVEGAMLCVSPRNETPLKAELLRRQR